MENILTKIREERIHRPPTWRRIADYFLEHYNTAQHIRMEDLRREISVSDGSIINFVRSLDCEGFAHFKVLLAQATGSLSERYTADQTPVGGGRTPAFDGEETLARMAGETVSAIDELVREVPSSQILRLAEAAASASRVVIFGVGTSGSIAEIFAGYLLLLGIPSHAAREPRTIGLTARTLAEGDLAVAVSYSGATPDIVAAIQTASGRGATTALLTSFAFSQAAAISDLAIYLPSVEASRGEFPVIARLGELLVINAVCAEIAKLRETQTQAP